MDGERIIERQPLEPTERKWRGHMEADTPRGRAWYGASPEQVTEYMNETLGPVPDSAYRVIEGA